jgi:site-specific DNA recombinase
MLINKEHIKASLPILNKYNERSNNMPDNRKYAIYSRKFTGKHEGIIEGKRWVEVQHLLEKNRDKAYRKPKSNTALLSGLLFCACCGSFMRPKLSSRVNKQGEKVYDYLCELKERSHGLKCDNKRINGNELDRQICDEIKHLGEDDSELMKLLRNSQKSLNETFADSQAEIDRLTEKKTDEQYQSLADMLSSFANTIDTLDVMKKRDVIRCFVRRVEWDGENVHLYLMGAESEGD